MSSPGSYVRLETRGRKTGKSHSVIVRYVTYDGKLVVFPQRGTRPDWVSNLLAYPHVLVLGEGKAIEGTASIQHVESLGDPLLGAFMRKYGEKEVRNRYWGQREYVQIEPTGSSQAYDYDELVYGDLEAAFDGVADDYDRHIFGNKINVWLRNRSVSLMVDEFQRGDVVLEVGCGTGTETISLAKEGIKVIATDISSKMLEVLRSHSIDAGVEDLVMPIHCRPYQLQEKLTEAGYPRVDGAYSTYGAVNTEPRLHDFFRNVHSLLKPEGKLILGVWNKFCIYEMGGYLLKGNPSLAFARFRNPVPVGKSRFCVSTNAYSVESLARILDGLFTLERAYGVGVLLPPSNLTRYLPPEPVLSLSKSFEVRFGSSPPWNRIGDHFLAVCSKVN